MRARAIFEQENPDYPKWRRMEAMEFYSWSMIDPFDERPLSRQEADLAAASLLQIIGRRSGGEELGRRAAELFAEIVYNQMRRIFRGPFGHDGTLTADKKWVRGRVRQLRLLLGDTDPLVCGLERRIFEAWESDAGGGVETKTVLRSLPSPPTPAIESSPSQPWMRRLRRRLESLRRHAGRKRFDLGRLFE